MRYYLVDTDNFAGDYPMESYLRLKFGDENDRYSLVDNKLEASSGVDSQHIKAKEFMQRIANRINNLTGEESPRFIKVVDENYELDRSTPND